MHYYLYRYIFIDSFLRYDHNTILIFAPEVTINFDLELSGSKEYQVGVFINNKLVKETGLLSGEFEITSSHYGEGYHHLNLVVLSNSGTGSLADVVGSELVLLKIHKTINIIRSIPQPLILHAYPDEGRLRIEWQGDNQLTAKSVIIEYPIAPTYTATWTYHISEPDQTFIIDSLYIGSELNIKIINQSTFPDKDPSQETILAINHKLPQPRHQ